MLWTNPVLVVAVTVNVYVPGLAGVTGVVPPPPPPPPEFEVLEPPHPATVKAAIESIATSKAPQRRRRGSVSRSMQARVAPEPAAYHGTLFDGYRPEGISLGLIAFAVVACEA